MTQDSNAPKVHKVALTAKKGGSVTYAKDKESIVRQKVITDDKGKDNVDEKTSHSGKD